MIKLFQSTEDSKWNIDRDKLILGATLGEGEFGLVVKGILTTATEENNTKQVAVKMLKRIFTFVSQLVQILCFI